MSTANQKKWERVIAEKLVGRKIVAVRYLGGEECEDLDWYGSSIVLFLDDGNYIFPSQDDEGNGPGALFTSYEDLPTFPVC